MMILLVRGREGEVTSTPHSVDFGQNRNGRTKSHIQRRQSRRELKRWGSGSRWSWMRKRMGCYKEHLFEYDLVVNDVQLPVQMWQWMKHPPAVIGIGRIEANHDNDGILRDDLDCSALRAFMEGRGKTSEQRVH